MSTSHQTDTNLTAALGGTDALSEADAERLSALLDGELDDAQTAAACARWQGDTAARSRWHSYGLIGDALRSDELAHTSTAGDAAFLLGVRERLAHEPVPIGRASAIGRNTTDRGASAAAARRQLRRWTTPIGVAAGVLMVAGLAWTLRPDAGIADPAAQLAAAGAAHHEPQNRPLADAMAVPAAPDRAVVAAVDDAELQPYLRVHRFYAGQSSAGPTPVLLRAAALAPGAR
jgi:sigma-E factor negative regulatory protein RseA